MPRHQLTHDDRKRGGTTTAQKAALAHAHEVVAEIRRERKPQP